MLISRHRKLLRSGGALAVLALSLTAGPVMTPSLAQTQDKPAGAVQIAPNLSHFTLANGLEVVVIPDHRAPVVTHMIWYKVGSADEPEGESGVAHFLEHLMFKGTKDHPDGAFSTLVAEIGGQENAFTSYDYTAYFQRVSKDHLAKMMEMEADRMQNLILSDAVVNPERDVVLEERRMRVENDPGSRLNEALTAITFVNHPYGSPVIGWKSEIEALDKEKAIAFYNRFYTPNNAIVVIAGDVEADQVKKLAEETYGKVARRAEPGPRIRPAEPPLAGERRVAVTDERVRQESISMSWIVPSQHTGEGRIPEALDVLSYIMGGGATSRLHKEAVLNQKIAISAGAYYSGDALDDGRFGFYATPAPGHTLDEMETVIRNELAKLISEGVTPEELARAKNSMLADLIYAQDSQQTLARIFGASLAAGQTIEQVQNWPSQIQAVTAEDVQNAARTYLEGDPVIGELKMPKQDEASSANANTTAPKG